MHDICYRLDARQLRSLNPSGCQGIGRGINGSYEHTLRYQGIGVWTNGSINNHLDHRGGDAGGGSRCGNCCCCQNVCSQRPVSCDYLLMFFL